MSSISPSSPPPIARATAYPLMRGTGPLIVAVLSAAVIGERLTTGAWANVLLICSGVLGLALAYRRPHGSILEPAVDLATRLAKFDPHEVLETAAGTGVLTRQIASRLPACAHIVAADLNQSMLSFAAARQSHDFRIEWRQADALALPFDDAKFDVVACQFGVMFFPDKCLSGKFLNRLNHL